MSGKPRDTGSVYRLRVEALGGGHLGAQGLEASEMESTLPSAPWEAQGQARAEPCSPQTRVEFHTSAPALVLHPPPKARFYPGRVTLLHLPISHLSTACTERCRHRAASRAASCGDCSRDREWPSWAWPPSLRLLSRPSPTAGRGALLPPPASLEFPCLPFPQRTELGQLHKAQAAENPPRPKVPVLEGTIRGSWLVEASGYPEMLHSDHQGPRSGSRVQGQEGKVPHML